jgi:tRNA pseudouridine38-40 synthase
MRYFLHLSYNGTRFCGWQRQPQNLSVQEKLEEGLAILLRQPIEVTGCGRTDAGVHARAYIAHFDWVGVFPTHFLERLNKLIGRDIAVIGIEPVADDAHARFDAIARSYEYHIGFVKNPFGQETEWFYPFPIENLDRDKMQAAAKLLLNYKEFAPFCRTRSDAKTMICELSRSEWIFEENSAVYHVTSNRFLRGMVRMIVGACVNVGLSQVTMEELRSALDDQRMIVKSYSVPAEGLYLTKIVYP